MKKKIKQDIAEFNIWDLDGLSIDNAIVFFSKIKEKSTQEIKIEIILNGDAGCVYNDSLFSIEREETDLEYNNRLKSEHNHNESQRIKELQELQRLRNKYKL